MLSIFNISSTQAAVSYFEKDNYYSKNDPEQKTNSTWFGKGAESMGLKGEVNDKDFENILNGKIPNENPLGRKEAGKLVHAPGIDMTFSAPKSVSIQAEVNGDKRIYIAHKAAVEKALNYVQDNLVTTRKMVDGKIVDDKVKNITAALFRHNTSRNFDPQLHTHCVIANAVKRDDGKWRSSDFGNIFDNKILLGQIYRSELANSMQELGYEIKVTGNKSLFELSHIPDSLNKVFSSRSEEIKDAGKDYLNLNAKMKAHLARITRTNKQEIAHSKAKVLWNNTVKEHNLVQEKQKEDAELAVSTPSIPRQVSDYFKNKLEAFIARFDYKEKHISTDQTYQNSKLSIEVKSVEYAIDHLSKRNSVWHERELLSHALSYSTGSSNIDRLTKEISKYKKSGILLESKSEGKDTAGLLTSNSVLILEKGTNQIMIDGKNQTPKIASSTQINSSLAQTHLNKGQVESLKAILNSNDRVVGIQGFAGTGKTTMLTTAKDIAATSNYKFHGLAPSGSAAITLQSETGVHSETLHKFLFRYDGVANGRGTKQGRIKMQNDLKNTVIVLDEASLAGTKQINALLTISQKLNFKVALLGDVKQLEGVEAGNPFNELQKAGMQTAKLDNIMRQKDAKFLSTVYDATKGNIKAAFDKLGEHIHEPVINSKSREDIQTTLANHTANEWLSLSDAERKETLITAPSNIIRQQINSEIRKALQFEGELKGNVTTLDILVNKNLTAPEQKQSFNYQPGDQIVFGRDFKSLSIKRGEVAKVVDVAKGVVQLIKNGKTIPWKPSELSGHSGTSISVYRGRQLAIQAGEKLRWTKNNPGSHEIINTKEVQFTGLNKGKLGFVDSKGKVTQLEADNSALKHLDYAYASTVHAAQGKTVNNIIGVMESSHPHLTNQKSFYVTISRARLKATLITDNKESLEATLEKQTGARISSLEHQTPVLKKEANLIQEIAPVIKTKTIHNSHSIKDIYHSMYSKLPHVLPHFSFKNCGSHYVSTTGHKIDGSNGKSGKVYVYANNPGLLKDYTRGNKSIYDYIKDSSMPSADKAEMMRYLSDISGLGSANIQIKSTDGAFHKASNDNKIEPPVKVDKKLMNDIHMFAINSLSHQTPSNPVKNYLTNIRGYSIENLKKMELGCINSKQELGKYLKSLNWSDAKIKEAYKALNYIGQTHKLVIPFKNSKGETIGFAGRNIDYKETDTIGKYLYTKGLSRSGTLTNAHNLNEKKSAVIVEGLLDSLNAQAKGIENVVSLGGTAFNKSQLALLQDKGVQSITLCLDNDKAGKEASNRIKEIIQHSKAEMQIKEVTLPNNIKDPDQLIKERGSAAFEKAIADAKEITSKHSISPIQHQNSNTSRNLEGRGKDEEFSK